MLENNELNTQLFDLIENSEKIEKAISLVKENEVKKPYIYAWQWFLDSYQKSTKPLHWLKFFEQFLSLNLQKDHLRLQKFFTSSIENLVTKPIDDNLFELILLALHQNSSEDNLRLLSSIVNSPNNELAINLLNNTKSYELRSNLYFNLVKISYDKYNGFLLQKLLKIDNKREFDFNSSIEKLNLKLHDQRLDKLLSMNKEELTYINMQMKPFVNGFGNINYNAGLLAIAERKNRKKDYDYNPTLLNITDDETNLIEFEEFLKVLKETPLTLSERFIFSASHWISGEISIEQGGIPKILFIDSLGADEEKLYKLTEDAIKVFFKIFPQGKIFVSQERRQNAIKGCSVYALDDIAHLFRLHLEKKYEETKLFGFLNDVSKEDTTENIIVNDENKSINVSSCKIPLSLMRTMQSEKLLNKTIPSRTQSEQETPINKKGETAKGSSMKFFKENELSNKLQNNRLSYKLKNMQNYIFNFLINNTPETIEKLMRLSTLEKFKERMQVTQDDYKIKKFNNA